MTAPKVVGFVGPKQEPLLVSGEHACWAVCDAKRLGYEWLKSLPPQKNTKVHFENGRKRRRGKATMASMVVASMASMVASSGGVDGFDGVDGGGFDGVDGGMVASMAANGGVEW